MLSKSGLYMDLLYLLCHLSLVCIWIYCIYYAILVWYVYGFTVSTMPSKSGLYMELLYLLCHLRLVCIWIYCIYYAI